MELLQLIQSVFFFFLRCSPWLHQPRRGLDHATPRRQVNRICAPEPTLSACRVQVHRLWTNKTSEQRARGDGLVCRTSLALSFIIRESRRSLLLRGRRHSVTGPSSVWSLREFQLWEGVNDARRLAGYLCRISGAEHKTPDISPLDGQKIRGRILTRMARSLPFEQELSHRGPLPFTCGCLYGLDEQGDFVSSRHNPLDTRFWSVCL